MDNLIYKPDKREKKYFSASDALRPTWDLYHALLNIEPTNPPAWNDTLKWGAGKGVELAMLKVLKDSGIVPEDYNQETMGGFKMEREGLTVSGYIDAIDKNGEPIEIKSINNANKWDIAKYEKGEPRKNHVMQLAIYMDYLGKENGVLFVASIDGLSTFWIPCKHLGNGKYQCGSVVVDVYAEYIRWKKIMENHVKPKQTPDPFEIGRYKIPVEEVDWSKVSVSDISKARNGHKVIGDPDTWPILYSPWKQLWVDAQGVKPWYSDEELARIKELTKGFSTKKK